MKKDIKESSKSSLISHLTDEEKEELKAYFSIYEYYHEKVTLESRRILRKHPIIGPIIANMSKEQLDENSKVSRKLQKKAIFEDEWDLYLDHLVNQGIHFANLGMRFYNWVEVVELVRNILVPYLEIEYEKDSLQTMKVVRGLNRFMDIALAVIGEAYLNEKMIIIDKQLHEQKQLIGELKSFAYVISHDLKTPMRGISQLSDILLQDYKDKLDDAGKEYLIKLKNRVTKLYNLIEGVLVYSKAGKEEKGSEEINVNTLIKDVLEMVESEPEVKVKFVNELPTIKSKKI